MYSNSQVLVLSQPHKPAWILRVVLSHHTAYWARRLLYSTFTQSHFYSKQVLLATYLWVSVTTVACATYSSLASENPTLERLTGTEPRFGRASTPCGVTAANCTYK